MKVLKGSYKGVELCVPEGGDVRPTVDRVKKHVLRIADEIRPRTAWDLFAGAGGMGIEFLSAGAEQVVFVERLKRAVSCLNLNLSQCRLKDADLFERQDARIVVSSVEEFLKDPGRHGVERIPDLVFMDPPYGMGWMCRVLPLIAACPVLAPRTLCIAEHLTDEGPEVGCAPIRLERQQAYGPKMLSLFRKAAVTGGCA